jgi:hypothetical protein
MTSAERLTLPREDSAFATLVEPYRGSFRPSVFRRRFNPPIDR